MGDVIVAAGLVGGFCLYLIGRYFRRKDYRRLYDELMYQEQAWERASEDFGDFQSDMALRCWKARHPGHSK
jgi:membrane protein DedA with SNARE-associated domain